MQTRPERFLQRVMCFTWRPAIDNEKYTNQCLIARGYHNAASRKYLVKRTFEEGQVNRHKIIEGIVVGIAPNYYQIVQEWSSFESYFTEEKLLKAPQIYTLEAFIIYGTRVCINELLTHPHDAVRTRARMRVETKGVDFVLDNL